MSDDGILDFTFGDEESEKIRGGKQEVFKGRLNEKNRIALVYFKEVEDAPEDASIEKRWDIDGPPRFKGGEVYFKKGNGLGYTLYSGDDRRCLKVLGDLKGRIVTVVVVYRTDEEGNPLKPINEKQGWKVVPWAFGKDKFDDIKILQRGSPLQENDVIVSCTNADYQHLKFFNGGKALWRHDKLRRAILTAAEKVAKDLDKVIGTKRTSAEILDKLGIADSPDATGDGASSDVDYSDLLGDD